jgi:hypothetical protein
MAKLVGFTVLFARTKGNYDPGGTQRIRNVSAPSNWQLSEIGQVPPDLCVDDPKADCYRSPTVTFQATNPNAGISPGTSLDGFSLTYDTVCGIYCDPIGPSVIAVSSTPVPEPVTILGSAIALGFGITLKRKYSKTHSNKT